jgi:hypothetical protein
LLMMLAIFKLLPPLINNVAVAYLIPCLLMTRSMIWHLRNINKGWCEVMGETIASNALELIKVNNQAY